MAVALALATLALWWPGIATYDTVAQYRQMLAGTVDDWHPPIMARLWAVLHRIAPGAGPLYLVQVAGYWIGFGAIATRLALSGRGRAGVAVLMTAIFPVFLGWQIAVLKDGQMAGAMLAATGLVGWWRLADRRVPRGAIVAIVILLGYATLVRANAVFATIPLAIALMPRPARPSAKVALGIAATALVLVVSPIVNTGLLRAAHTEVARTQPIYDLAGIAAHLDATAPMSGLSMPERGRIVGGHCYTPFFWDPMGDDAHCGAIAERLDAVPRGALMRDWIAAIAEHPVAYLRHRIGHLNSTERWIVPVGWISATPPDASLANDLGLESPGPAARVLVRVDEALVETPLGWPVAWIVVAATSLWVALRRASAPARNLALALALSTLTLELSFAVISIASDLRYHLWPMIAAALAAVLLLDGHGVERRAVIAGGAALAVVVASGVAARLTLPHGPESYAAMLG